MKIKGSLSPIVRFRGYGNFHLVNFLPQGGSIYHLEMKQNMKMKIIHIT